MVSKPVPAALTVAELRFWQAAFLADEISSSDAKKLPPEGRAHLRGEFADAAVREFRSRRQQR